jgi:diguanylate cyclase (GGDEF)-like protein
MSEVMQALRETSARSRELITASADGILVMELSGRILFAKPAACALVGVEAAQLVGRVIDESLTDTDTVELEFQPDQVVELRIAETTWEDAPALVAALRDITAHRTAELALKKLNNRLQTTNSRLQQLAFADPLTELLNRRGLEHMLQGESSRARRRGAPMVACLVDCDDFKAINDQHGHVVGDAVLRELSRRLAKGLRLSDHLARVGGDEFLVLLPETRLVEGMQIASRLRAAAADEPIRHGELKLPLTVSLGVAEVASECGTVQEILAATQSALHESKTQGKNRVTGPAPGDEVDQAFRRGRAARPAEGRQPARVFQPILGLPDEDLQGYEVLSRGPRGRWEMPDQFFTLGTTAERRAAIDLRCAENCLSAIDRLPPGLPAASTSTCSRPRSSRRRSTTCSSASWKCAAVRASASRSASSTSRRKRCACATA